MYNIYLTIQFICRLLTVTTIYSVIRRQYKTIKKLRKIKNWKKQEMGDTGMMIFSLPHQPPQKRAPPIGGSQASQQRQLYTPYWYNISQELQQKNMLFTLVEIRKEANSQKWPPSIHSIILCTDISQYGTVLYRSSTSISIFCERVEPLPHGIQFSLHPPSLPLPKTHNNFFFKKNNKNKKESETWCQDASTSLCLPNLATPKYKLNITLLCTQLLEITILLRDNWQLVKQHSLNSFLPAPAGTSQSFKI